MNKHKQQKNIKCRTCIERIHVLESVLESMSDAVIVLDKAGEFVIFNPAAKRIIGRSPQKSDVEFWAKEYGVYYPNSDELYPTDRLPILRALRGELLNEIELSIKSPARAEKILVTVSARPLRNEHGEVWAGLAVFRDITKRKAQEAALFEGEERLRQHAIELEKERAKYEALLDSVGGGLIAVDEEGNIIKINKSGEKILGLNADDTVGASVLDIFDLEDEQGSPVPLERRPVILALSEGRRTIASYYYVCKNGKRFPAFTVSTPVRINKKIIGAIVVFHDIAREIEIDKAKSEFVALASHQLRTPLSTIRWYTQALLEKELSGMKLKERRYVQEIYRANRRMIELVDCLLNVSRIELGTFAIEPEPVALQAIVQDVILELQSRIKAKKLAVRKKFAKNIPIINADRNLMRIVLQNIISNAVKYTPRRGNITIGMKKNNSDVLISVIDNGYGIPKSQQSKIFTKLFRADNAQELEADGTGLGLYIVKSIIDKSCSKIWFESSEGTGTTFYVTIPLTGMQKKTGNKKLRNPFYLYSSSNKGHLQETILHTQYESIG